MSFRIQMELVAIFLPRDPFLDSVKIQRTNRQK
jgi:hypothetical protein